MSQYSDSDYNTSNERDDTLLKCLFVRSIFVDNICFVGPKDLITMRTIVGECVGKMNRLDMVANKGLRLAVGAQRTLVFTIANAH